jgi:hypothetical protein
MKIGKRSPQFLMSLRDTPNHEKTRRMGGAKRNPSGLFVAETVHSPVKERDEFHHRDTEDTEGNAVEKENRP